MKNFKIIYIIIFSIALFLIPACEDDGGELNLPDELVGNWNLSEMDASLVIGSNLAQTGVDMFSKGQSAIQVKGQGAGPPNVELAYMLPIEEMNEDESEGPSTSVVLTNQPISEGETGPTFPVFMLMLEEGESSQEKIAMMSVQLSETDQKIYVNLSDFVLDESNFSLTMTNDTLFLLNSWPASGELDTTKYFILDGTFKASTIPFAVSDSNEVAFPMLEADFMDENMTILMEKDGTITTSFTEDDGFTETDKGEWYVSNDNVLVMVFEYEDGEIDTLAMPYSFSGSQLQLTRYENFCEAFGDEDPLFKRFRSRFSEPCYEDIEDLFLLAPNSVTQAVVKMKMSFIQGSAKQRFRLEWEPPSNADWEKVKSILRKK
jgi:hypothetical protein